MSPSELEARPKQKVERREESTRPGVYVQPAVDIFETPDDGIRAQLGNGVLALRLPKAARARARRITVNAA